MKIMVDWSILKLMADLIINLIGDSEGKPMNMITWQKVLLILESIKKSF
jgi:hypothetical protein